VAAKDHRARARARLLPTLSHFRNQFPRRAGRKVKVLRSTTSGGDRPFGVRWKLMPRNNVEMQTRNETRSLLSPSAPPPLSLSLSTRFSARWKISAAVDAGRGSFKMQMVALIFALSAAFPFPCGGSRSAACNREIGTATCARVRAFARRGLNRVNFNCTAP